MTDHARGDFERLLGGLQPKLHRYRARMTGSAVDGEDIVQDAMMKALAALPDAGVIANPDGWLFRIAHNTALDFLRRRARQPMLQNEEVLDIIAGPDSSDQDHEVTEMSLRTFMRLPALQRSAVILKDVLDHSLDEVSSITGASEAAAKSALQRGRARLREFATEPADMSPPMLSGASRVLLIKYLDAARRDLPRPTEIKASTIPANGVVSFVDEMIHHMTPLYGHRKVTAAKLATFLQTKYAARYAKAFADYGAYQKTTNAWGVAATVGSWIGSWFSDPVEEGRKWYRWIGMTKTTSKFDRVELAKSGLSPADVEELVDEYSEFASGFGGVSIPGSDRAPIRDPDTPRLTRQMNSKALAKTIPPPVTGDRRFFRTWVRAVRR